jgi:hypothetical protein
MEELALDEPDGGEAKIVIRLSNLLQLYHTLDPAPFREKALATDAERYIVDQAEELSKAAPIEIMIHLANAAPSRLTALDVASAIAQHFLVRSEDKTRELRALLKTGRRALIIGLVILASCFAAGWLAGLVFGNGPLPDVLRESFLILGWVAIWKPSEIFLYGWPAIVQERELFKRLSTAKVVLTCVSE